MAGYGALNHTNTVRQWRPRRTGDGANGGPSNQNADAWKAPPSNIISPRRRNSIPRSNEMPALTSPHSQQAGHSPNSSSNSRSASPVRPTYSPITPTLSTARLASSPNNATQAPRQTFTHSQVPQISIPQPQPEPIKFDENPDVLALKAAASILQMQARKAAQDIQTLQRMKEKALAEPEEFARALQAGEIKNERDMLFNPGRDDSDDDDDDGDADDIKARNMTGKDTAGKKWEKFPTPQNVVRCPPINWHQYAVVGESLDKLHKDQVERPSEGVPQRLGPDRQMVPGGEGARRVADMGVAAPYQPGRDKIEKAKKGGKR